MKKRVPIFTNILMIAIAFSFTNAIKQQAPIGYTVNTKESKVEFIGNKKSGYHPGYFPVKSGNVNVDNGKIIGGKFIINIAAVKITDESGEHLEGTLKSKDFFNAANFGLAEYEITTVNYKDDTHANITGNLTVKGIKAEVVFTAIVREINDKMLFAQGFFSVDRTKIGLPGFEKDISKDVQIAVHLFANK